MPHLFLTSILQFLIDLDTRLFLYLNAHHNMFWDVFMFHYSSKWVWVPLYLSITYVIARNFSWRAALICLVAGVCLVVITDQVASSLLRPIIGRLRPSNLQNPISDMVHIVDGYRGGRFGFPSAHSANSWGLAFFILYLFRSHKLTVFLCFWATINCYSRIYLGVHYLGDLLIGMLVGFTSASVVYHIFQRITHYQRPPEIKGVYLPIYVGFAIMAFLLILSTYQTVQT
ncbi:MAG: phosphatase PAP2 family protein [Prevotella sp.]|nr:phosphatase PAP2 family protein [Prevotella sp.]